MAEKRFVTIHISLMVVHANAHSKLDLPLPY
jgi:hypothetical protein